MTHDKEEKENIPCVLLLNVFWNIWSFKSSDPFNEAINLNPSKFRKGKTSLKGNMWFVSDGWTKLTNLESNLGKSQLNIIHPPISSDIWKFSHRGSFSYLLHQLTKLYRSFSFEQKISSKYYRNQFKLQKGINRTKSKNVVLLY